MPFVEAFNPFIFKVIIDKYDPVANYVVVLSSSLYTFPVFPVQGRSFRICWRTGLVVLNSLSFCLSVKLLISLSCLNEIVPLPCSLFGVLYSGRLKPQWADGLPPKA